MVVSIVVVIIAVVIIKVGVLMYGHKFNLARPGLLDHAARTPPLERPASAPRQRFPAMPETAGIAALLRIIFYVVHSQRMLKTLPFFVSPKSRLKFYFSKERPSFRTA